MAAEYSYGLTFFLAQNNSVLIPNGSMGLPIMPSGSPNRPRFVAVEFDTYWDSWDPRDASNTPIGDHVGIIVNSLDSVKDQKWSSNVTGGGVCEAWIRYDSRSNDFSVSFTGYQNNTIVRQEGFTHKVDLSNELPESVIFGFSAATGPLFQKNILKSWSFDSWYLDANPDPEGRKNMVGLIVGLSVTVPFLVILLVVLWRWKRTKRREDEAEDEDGGEVDIEMNKDFEMGSGPKRFSYQELAQSTRDFALQEKLGEGGFGGVYKGFLRESRTYVAVKRMSKTSKQGIKQYASEVRIISRLRHKNLVQLIGWCHEKHELMLVYEYMENGSLDSHLFKLRSLLAWDTRYKIAHGLASALLYLHEEWEQCVLHRDIKSSNVMLDTKFNAKLGDFGLAKLVDHDKGVQTTMLAGTLGYMAPESVVTGKASKESDVYSFGVVALEIACGRKPIDHNAQEPQTRLVEWVWELYGTRTLLDAVDPRLGSNFVEEEIKQLMVIGLWCVHPDSNLRPSMRQVIQVLNSEAPLPVLSSTMPVASYPTPSMSSLFGVASVSQNQSVCIISNTDSSKQMTSSTTSSCSPSVSLLQQDQLHE
ncbi:hypothetical protein M8C21_021622 [Ambrosia artemisiifolia]|uniref:non-specific serine/threonine protein kinase n=1 Tax=Ambrosia artemisiifolia TaxID=4212 RepID=A0AAD5BXW7_AMBAR|nr:hypothetical protein M8C21_021622 [Ambrosia artemisiifolia]